MNVRFGPAGNSESFSAMGYKKNIEIPLYLEQMGLDAYEYQCGRGVKISEDAARTFGAACTEKGIAVSLHAPYYISMSSVEEEKRDNSVDYVLQSARAVSRMGGERVVIHTGSCGKITREYALELALDTMRKCIQALDNEGFHTVRLCPETMGKLGQLGTLDETLALCKLDERLLPCVDFGHLNARTYGGLADRAAVTDVFDRIERVIGAERARDFHVHFSKIAFTNPGGEKCHLTFADTEYGPEFEPVAEELARRGSRATIICESAGTQAEDAATMRQLYAEKGGA